MVHSIMSYVPSILHLGAVTAILALSCPPLPAQNETPTDACGRMFEPYEWEIQNTGVADACDTALTDQHYCRLRTTSTAAGTIVTPPAVTVLGVWAAMQTGYGVFCVDTHGSTNGIAIESYEWTANGKTARDNAYDHYVNNLGFAGQIYKANVANEGYHISVKGTALGGWFLDRKSIVFNSSCEGNAYAGSWGARVVLDYDTCPSPAAAVVDANIFWPRMNGKKGEGLRPAGMAKPGGMELTGNGDTVLSPIVKNRAPDVPGIVEFDATMDTSVAPSSVVSAVGATLSGHAWANNTTITFDVVFLSNTRKYTVHAASARSGNNQIQLDGNQCELGPNGEGPNQDDFCWSTDLILTQAGSCPGTMIFTAEGANPGAYVALIYAMNTGSIVIPPGFPCAGTQLDLDSTATLFGTVAADGGGNAVFGPVNVPPGACGRVHLQAMDLSSCKTSNTLLIQ